MNKSVLNYFVNLILVGSYSIEEDLILVLPDVSIKTVQHFLQFFYTGYTSFSDGSELESFQNFVQNQMKFTGRFSINEVYQDLPDLEYQNLSEQYSGQKSVPDLDALKLLSQLSPVRMSGGNDYLTGNDQFKVKTETEEAEFQQRQISVGGASNSANLQHPPMDDTDTDIPSIVSNFFDGHSVFSPGAVTGDNYIMETRSFP